MSTNGKFSQLFIIILCHRPKAGAHFTPNILHSFIIEKNGALTTLF